MKYISISKGCVFGLLLIGILFPLKAQDTKEKGTVIIDFTYSQKDAEMPVLRAYAKSKINKKFLPVEGVVVNFFMGEETAAGFLGSTTTDRRGLSFLSVPVRAKADWDSLNSFTFIATVTGSDQFDDTSSEVEITKARIELMLLEEDSVRSITARLLEKQDSGWVAVPATELKFVVMGQFSDLPISEDVYETDENGEASAEYMLVIPGDEAGSINLGAKVEDNEVYGSLTATQNVQWGLLRAPDNSFEKRTLFATRDKTPIWLLVFPNLIIITVWGIIFYLMFQIIQIRRIGTNNATK